MARLQHVKNIAEKLNPLSREHHDALQTIDRRQTELRCHYRT